MAVRGRRATDDGRRAARDEVLVRVGDLAGRPRGTGFVADHHGTVVTSHEAVDGLARIVVHASGDRVCVVTSDAVTPLPALDLALIRTEGLCVDPLPFALRDDVGTGAYVRIAAGGWREARVLGTADVTYTATDGFHLLRAVLELAIGTAGSEALRLGGGAAGGPVVDATTGAVVGILGTALEAQHRTTGFAVPLRGWRAEQPLAELLARNAATVAAYGTDLNLAGVLELTATTVGSDGPGAGAGAVAASGAEPVERVDVVREFTTFADGPATVLGLVGPPGSGRTTELAALAARRGRGSEPAPTLWLRGADLLSDDASLADAARRALERAGRIVAASATEGTTGHEGAWGSGARRGSGACRPGLRRLRRCRGFRETGWARWDGRRPAGTAASWGTSGRSGSPGSPWRRGGPCCCFWTGPRRCRRRSRTGWPNGPPGRSSGCGRTGLGSWWPAVPSTGSGPGRSSRRSCCTGRCPAERGSRCPRACGSVI